LFHEDISTILPLMRKRGGGGEEEEEEEEKKKRIQETWAELRQGTVPS
jgi:hypothetical protein